MIDGDFNNDGAYNCLDVDALVADIVGPGMPATFDLTGDGIVNDADLDAWLAEAGDVNLPSHNPYLKGDGNLDGVVDGVDFGIWNRFKTQSIPAWCSGDFNADGIINNADFTIWNTNKFQSALGANLQVPEPGSLTLLTMAIFTLWMRRNQ
jgi:hypothetical protein